MKRKILGTTFDTKSLKFKLWAYFALFAILIMVLLWFLQIFFLNNYYEEMKISETKRIAQELIALYGSDNFEENLSNLSSTNDLFIHIETAFGEIIYSPIFEMEENRPGKSGSKGPKGPNPSAYAYYHEINSLREKLAFSNANSISTIMEDPSTDYNTLVYANEIADSDGEIVRMYLFSPLYPVESTVTILAHQLIYVTIISLLFSLMIGVFLANRISRPLRNITESTMDLAKGKFGTTFKGEHYTEIIELADTLTYTSLELEKANAQQRDMMANVSHDLRTPLTMVKSYAEMIRDLSGDNPEKRNAHLKVIIDEADRLNLLVSDMLTLSRMQTGAMVIVKNPFSLKEATESVIDSYSIFAEQEGYTILLDCPSDITVNADESKIKQVISNLMTNAVKYCGNDRTVYISIKLQHGFARLEVSDHGMGISKEEIEHIWERYYKASTNHVRTTSGSGLGLSIVKEIILLHGGNYGVDSEPGKGSTFWFELKLN